MNFLAAVAAFLCMIVLAAYCFVTLGNWLLGLAGVAFIAVMFMMIYQTARHSPE